MPTGVEEEKGLYPPIYLTSSLNYTLGNNVPRIIQEPAPDPNNGFVDWSATWEGQFPNVYCLLEFNDHNAFAEENMNYPMCSPILQKLRPSLLITTLTLPGTLHKHTKCLGMHQLHQLFT